MAVLVLGFFENRTGSFLPCLEYERETLKEHFRTFRHDELVYEDLHNGGGDGLIKAIQERQNEVQWIHFSSHHTKEGEVQLFDVSFKNIHEVLLACPKLRGVFINGCSSNKSLEPVLNKIPIVIGTKTPVYDHFSSHFSLIFYRSLDLEDWNDYNRLRPKFSSAKELAENTRNLASELDCYKEIVRGGGDGLPKESEKDNYFINGESDELKAEFNRKSGLNHTNNIDNYEGIEQYLNAELEIQNFTSYSAAMPVLFKPVLRMIFTQRNLRDEKRYKNIEFFYDTCLNFCRYVILSTLWEELKDKIVDVEGTGLINLLNEPKNLTNTEIDCLLDLCEEIKCHGDLKERQIIVHIRNSLEFIKNSIESVNARRTVGQISDQQIWEAEELLQETLNQFAFLNQYKVRSVFTRYYQKYRHNDKPKFYIDGRKYDNYNDQYNLDKVTEETVGFECTDVHSIYLFKEPTHHEPEEDDDLKEPVINLSPFVFDRNFMESKATKMYLGVLQYYDVKSKWFHFKSIDPSDPDPDKTIRRNSDRPDDRFEFDENKIYDQLIFLVNILEKYEFKGV